MRSNLAAFASCCLVALVAGCGAAPDGPAGAPTLQRYVIDGLTLPARTTDFGDDLDGDGRVDNQLASILVALAAHGDDGAASIPSLLRGCAELPSLLVPAAGADGESVAAEWHGAPASGGPAVATIEGRLDGGHLVTTRTRALRRAVSGTLPVPVFADSDPIALDVVGLELELTGDASGWRGQLHGAITVDDRLRSAAWRAVTQMIAAHPADHAFLLGQLDDNRDGTVSLAEFTASPLVETLLAPDVRLFDGGAWRPDPMAAAKDSISLGVGLHLRRCDAGCCP